MPSGQYWAFKHKTVPAAHLFSTCHLSQNNLCAGKHEQTEEFVVEH